MVDAYRGDKVKKEDEKTKDSEMRGGGVLLSGGLTMEFLPGLRVGMGLNYYRIEISRYMRSFLIKKARSRISGEKHDGKDLKIHNLTLYDPFGSGQEITSIYVGPDLDPPNLAEDLAWNRLGARFGHGTSMVSNTRRMTSSEVTSSASAS